MSERIQVLAVSLALVIALQPIASAAQDGFPQTLAYQGYLTDAEGTPLTAAPKITFSFWDQPTGGERVWAEVQPEVPVSDGLFSVELGRNVALRNVTFDQQLWLGVQVDDAQELTPRVALAAVPFALNVKGIRVIPGRTGDLPSPSIIGGHPGNSASGSGVPLDGATISGGGTDDGPNQIESSYATISGGAGNLASGFYATISGGLDHVAEGVGSWIGGGSNNRAGGLASMVPGGVGSHALGTRSFAAGLNARSLHDGSFVWSDGSLVLSPFESTGENQFLIRSAGGVGIGTNTPTGALHVQAAGDAEADLVVGGTEDDDNGLITSDLSLPSSDLNFFSNGQIGFKLDANNDETSATFIVTDGEDEPVFSVSERGRIGANEVRAVERALVGWLEAEDELGDKETPEEGGVYRDNVVYAWAHVTLAGTVTASYGCTVSKLTGTGLYRVNLNRQLPNGASATVTVQTLNDPVIATAVTGSDRVDVATKVFNGAAFIPADYGFYVQVVGRP